MFMDQLENLFVFLKEIYGDKVFYIDNQISDLKAKGCFSNMETKRPDFLILDFELL
jgi:hypothetical protein